MFEQPANDLANIKNQRLIDPNTVVIGHLNINSFRNKYEMFAEFIGNFNICLISESKLDDACPNKQFYINGFKIFRCDRDRYGGGLIYVHEGIPCKPLKIPLFDLNIEIIGLEFHQIKRNERINRLLLMIWNSPMNLSKFLIISLANMKN